MNKTDQPIVFILMLLIAPHLLNFGKFHYRFITCYLLAAKAIKN